MRYLIIVHFFIFCCYSSANSQNGKSFYLPVRWNWNDDKFTITNTFDDSLSVYKGCFILRINDTNPETYFNIDKDEPWANFVIETKLLQGYKNSTVTLLIIDAQGRKGRITLKRTMNELEYYLKVPYGEILKDPLE